MLKRTIRFALRLGVIAGLAAILIKLLEDQEASPAPVVAEPKWPEWVEPQGAMCPASHPIKVKLSSKVFRRPDSPGYDASKPDRCYVSEAAALDAGFREAKR